jgi:prepilin-type N-terminal cleavage/methylation domain-containing protein/prepilin-type processing-associated H-X9-DG protein
MLLNSQKTASRTKAFTLVELLVVIGVIALLMGILVPVLGKARAASAATVCKSNLRNIALGFRAYLDDNGNVMPPACRFPSLYDPNYSTRPPITQFLRRYLQEPNNPRHKIFRCPADTVIKYYISQGTSYEYNASLGGQPISRSRLAQNGEKERNIHVLSDYDPFHGDPNRPGGKNYLYADGHIGDLRNQ